jgi:hypothetical protein
MKKMEVMERYPLASWFRAPTLLLAWFAAALTGFAGAAEGPSFEVDLQRDLREVARLMIAGGVVGRAQESRSGDSAGVAPGGDDSAVAGAGRQPVMVEIFEAAHFAAVIGLLDEVTDALRERPEEAGDDWVPPVLSGNLAGGLHYGRGPEAAARFDALNNELNVAALGKELAHFLGAAAISEAVDAVLLVMPSAAANRTWIKKEDPVAYARGTGLTYALGGHMHIPWCLYEGTQFTRYYGTPATHQPIFRMIHDHRDRFDGYVPALWEVLEVPYGERGIQNIKAFEAELRKSFAAGIPVVVRFRGTGEKGAVAGSPFGDDRLDGEAANVRTLGEAVSSANPDGPFELLKGFDGAYLPPVPRVSSKASEFPLVIHLVRGFDEGTDRRAEFEISGDWLPADRVKDITLASVEWENDPATKVKWEAKPDGNTHVMVTGVPAWGVLRVETDAPVKLPGIMRSNLRERMAESEIPVMRMIRFGDRWKRPPWVDDALASDTDPLDGYHVTRITWSYESGGAELEHARSRGWGFHGSIGLLHTHMGPTADLKTSDMITEPPDWPGWARYPDGRAILIRPDWNPPRFGASFATEAYRRAVIERARQWLELGVTGIQFDDVMGMLNRIWQYGGDFSDALMEIFKARLLAAGFPDVTEATPLGDLRQRIIVAMQWENAARIVNAAPPGRRPIGWVGVPYRATSVGYPGEVWIGTGPFDRPPAPFVVRYDVRFSGGKGAFAEFILTDGDRTTYLSRFTIAPESHPEVPQNAWVRVRLKYDPVARTMRHAVGDGAEWSDPVPFEAMPVAGEPGTFTAIAMADPLVSGLDVRAVAVQPENLKSAALSAQP